MPIPKDKRKFALWLYPETLEKIKQHYTADDCRSKSEFIEKAVRFYIDHLTAEDRRSMLPNACLLQRVPQGKSKKSQVQLPAHHGRGLAHADRRGSAEENRGLFYQQPGRV